MDYHLHSFEQREELFGNLLQKLVTHIEQAIKRDGSASLVLSGGNTPIPLYRALAEQDFSWDRISLLLSDERYTSNTTATNEVAVKETFASCLQSGLQFYSLLNKAKNLEHAAELCNQQLKQVKRPFDFVLVGMGEDGHFASLFPHSIGLEEALSQSNSKLCAEIHPSQLPENAPYPRISLTLSALQNCKQLVLLITGRNKLKLIQRLDAQTDPLQFPISALLNQTRSPVQIYWSP